ncbi:MAG: sugar transferase [Melioribacteraceae bacterium]
MANIQSPLFKTHNENLKRIFDLIISIIICIFILPVLTIIIGTIIKLDSKGPIFFKQKRFGKNKKYFVLYKFRTMFNNGAEEITKAGYFLRKNNIDELPQFINVLKGEMSIVGPRPHEVNEDFLFSNLVKDYDCRYIVKPGITGWAQINNLRGKVNDINEIQKRFEYDIWYIENWSFWLDILIIIKTAVKMIKGDTKAC